MYCRSKAVHTDLKLRFFLSLFFLLIVMMWAIEQARAQSSKPLTIGLAVWSGYPESIKGFKDGLAEGGLIEGQNIHFIQGEPGADKHLQKKVAEKFKDAQVDLVYSLTTPGTTIMKETMPEDTPIVFSIVTYPADSGLIESFEYSGNNLVGTSNYVPLRHYIDLTKLLLPSAKRLAIFHRQGEPNSKIQSANLIRLFKRANIKVIDNEPQNIEQLKSIALSLVDEVDAFISTTDTLMQSGGEEVLINISLKHQIPILSSNKNGIIKGSSFGPVADFYTLGKISGSKAVKILRDRMRPTELQSELQNPPLFLANGKSLKSLGIKLTPQARQRISHID